MPKEGQRFRVDDDVERRIWMLDSSVTQFLLVKWNVEHGYVDYGRIR